MNEKYNFYTMPIKKENNFIQIMGIVLMVICVGLLSFIAYKEGLFTYFTEKENSSSLPVSTLSPVPPLSFIIDKESIEMNIDNEAHGFSFSFVMPHAQNNILGAILSTHIEIIFYDKDNARISDDILIDFQKLSEGHYICAPNREGKGIKCSSHLHFLKTANITDINKIVFIAKTDDVDGKQDKIFIGKEVANYD